MYLLHTVLHRFVSRSTAAMYQHLVIGILEMAGLRYRQTIVNESHFCRLFTCTIGINRHDIRQIEVGLTRGTNTVFRTGNLDGMSRCTGYMAPVRCITVYIHQSHLRQQFVIQMHTDGVR